MNTWKIADIAKVLRVTLPAGVHAEREIRELLTDSRQLRNPDHSLFFALKSRRNDGHQYIDELYAKGVRAFVTEDGEDRDGQCPEAVFLQVPGTLNALQQLAAAHRKQFRIPVIGITGSNGKTIVKEWLTQLLSDEKHVVRSPKSYNSQIGVPLSVWQIADSDEIGIFEAGISETDEMDRLQTIIQPTIGIFTNIGSAHDENFINRNQKVSEKLKLFRKVDLLIYCIDYVDITGKILQTEAFREIKTFSWGKRKEADLRILEVVRQHRHSDIRALYQGQEISITIPFIDDASTENCIHCWACLLHMGYPTSWISARMAFLQPVAMRLELKEGINNCSVINDSYSSDINSLSIALDFLVQQKQHRRRTVILSDVLQSGRNENTLYGTIAELLHARGVNQLIGIGPAISRQAAKFRMEKSFFKDTDDFLKKFPFSSFNNETILIKGARVYGFEQISRILQQKAHETVLEIDLNHLLHNLNLLRSVLNPGVKTMVMVKAFSYGSGSYEIANLLQFHHVDYLAVAYADEGVELRKAGISLPIMVMNPDEESVDALSKYQLEPEVYSFRVLRMIAQNRSEWGGREEGSMCIHLKMETGMNRLGFQEDQLDQLIEQLKEIRGIRVASVFSHLAASQDPDSDAFTTAQTERLKAMADRLEAGLGYTFLRHVLNSSGIMRFPGAQLDMVRIGISLYGIQDRTDSSGRSLDLLPVSKLRTTISQLKLIRAGESVGYNRRFVASHDMQLAVIPIGYADGLSRVLGNGRGHVMIRGKLCPILGDVCMDMCMVDVSGMEVQEEDDVIIFGPERPITQLAEEMGTIPYEVLTGISRRVKRVYYQE